MNNNPRPAMRLAFRVEGDWWVAYLAAPDTMQDATRIGSILLGIVTRNPDLKQAFMEMMQQALTAAIVDVLDRPPTWGEPVGAPESERSGRA